MFDHVQVKVADFERSRAFYEAVFGTLGYKVVLEFEGVVGIGTNSHEMFEIAQASDEKNLPLSSAVHIAFKAKSEDEVRAFHKTALAHGAKDNGAPGPRPEYEEGYFAAFVVDPDGHNLEVVFKRE